MTLRQAAATLLLLISSQFAVAGGALDDPFYATNRNPFVQVYGLPAAESAALLEKGVGQLAFQAEAANSFTISSNAREYVHIDGETYRANLSWRGGITERIELK